MVGARNSVWAVFSYFTRHTTMANLLMVIMIGAGLWAMQNMRVQFFPDDIRESIRVNATLTNASAEDLDTSIMLILEPALRAVDGVESSSAFSQEGRGTVFLQFENSWDMQQATADVSEVLQGLSGLPADAEVSQSFSSFVSRVADVVISSPVGVDQTAGYADEMVARLFAEGVTRTSIRGVAAPGTVVEVSTAKLVANDVTIAEIAAAIAAEVNADAAGDIQGAGARVRAGVEKRSATEIAGITLRSFSDGQKLVIGDIADIRVEGADRLRAYYVGNDTAVSIRVDRNASGDIIDIQDTVQRVADDMVRSLPSGSRIELIRTRAEAIQGRINILLSNGAMGLALVLVLLFLFLNWRTAFWVAMGIPTAMLAAVALMYSAGLTFNMISLFALIITLGIVVDDAIVVGEHADARSRMGEDAYTAAENAAARMSRPVFSATITTIIAFFGLMAVGGGFGRFLSDIPFTVIAVLAASLLECFLILPHHMATALRYRDVQSWADAPSQFVNKWFAIFRDRVFRRAMGYVIRGRYVVLAFAVFLLALQLSLLLNGSVRWVFFVPPEQPRISGNFAMTPDADRQDSLEMMQELQRAVAAVGARYEEEYGINPVVHVLGEIGGNTGRGLSGSETQSPDNLGAIAIELVDRDLRIPPGQKPYSTREFTSRLQNEYRRHPLQETVSFRRWRLGPGGDSLSVQFFGNSTEKLKAAAEELKAQLSGIDGVTGLEDSLAYDNEELILELTPHGRALGFTIDQLGAVLRNRIAGIEAATFPVGTRTATITVILPKGELTADFLERMQLRNPEGVYVQLADIVSVQSRPSFASVRRENGLRLVTVSGDIDGEDAELANAVNAQLETEILPYIASVHLVDWRLTGLNEDESRFQKDALFALGVVLAGIFLTLSWVFASWTRPLVVMSVIPFGLVGALFGHWAMGQALSMFSVVGLLGMTGIIINDSIVLVTQIDGYTKDRGIIPSIIDGASDRLRAVLLTTLTTVLGLSPLLFETSSDAQFLKPTVITLVFGLGFGMLLVLLVIPALMAIQADVSQLMRQSLVNLRFRRRGVRLMSSWALAAMLIWLGPTIGHAIFWGEAHPWISFMTNDVASPEFAAISAYFRGLFVILLALLIANIAWLVSIGTKGQLPPLDSSGAPRPTHRPRAPQAGPVAAMAGPSAAPMLNVSTVPLAAESGALSRAMGRAGTRLGGLLTHDVKEPAEHSRRMPPMPDPEGTLAFDDPMSRDTVDGRLLVKQATGSLPFEDDVDDANAVDMSPTEDSAPSSQSLSEPVGPENLPVPSLSEPDMTLPPKNVSTPVSPVSVNAPPLRTLRGADVRQGHSTISVPSSETETKNAEPSHRYMGLGWLVSAIKAWRTPAPGIGDEVTMGELEREQGALFLLNQQPDDIGSVSDSGLAPIDAAVVNDGQIVAQPERIPQMSEPSARLNYGAPAQSPLEKAIGDALAGDIVDRTVLDAAVRVDRLPNDLDAPQLDLPPQMEAKTHQEQLLSQDPSPVLPVEPVQDAILDPASVLDTPSHQPSVDPVIPQAVHVDADTAQVNPRPAAPEPVSSFATDTVRNKARHNKGSVSFFSGKRGATPQFNTPLTDKNAPTGPLDDGASSKSLAPDMVPSDEPVPSKSGTASEAVLGNQKTPTPSGDALQEALQSQIPSQPPVADDQEFAADDALAKTSVLRDDITSVSLEQALQEAERLTPKDIPQSPLFKKAFADEIDAPQPQASVPDMPQPLEATQSAQAAAPEPRPQALEKEPDRTGSDADPVLNVAVRRTPIAERLKAARMLPPATTKMPVTPTLGIEPQTEAQTGIQTPAADTSAGVKPSQSAAPQPKKARAQVNPKLSPEMLELALEMGEDITPDASPQEPAVSPPKPVVTQVPAAASNPVSLSMTDTFSAFMGPSGDAIQPVGRLARPRPAPNKKSDP
jgi:multidrug efflux pump subunit AcrB